MWGPPYSPTQIADRGYGDNPFPKGTHINLQIGRAPTWDRAPHIDGLRAEPSLIPREFEAQHDHDDECDQEAKDHEPEAGGTGRRAESRSAQGGAAMGTAQRGVGVRFAARRACQHVPNASGASGPQWPQPALFPVRAHPERAARWWAVHNQRGLGDDVVTRYGSYENPSSHH